MHIQPEQFPQPGQALLSDRSPEEVLQERPLVRLPGLLEAAARFLQPPQGLLRQTVQQGRQVLVHAKISRRTTSGALLG